MNKKNVYKFHLSGSVAKQPWPHSGLLHCLRCHAAVSLQTQFRNVDEFKKRLYG